jgi:acetyltransferase-like isoleucine patch superfamily enzyme
MKKFPPGVAKLALSLIRYREHRVFIRLRLCLLRQLGARIGGNVVIKAGVVIDYPENLVVGDGVSIQQNCLLSAYAPISIGSNVSIAHGVSIVTTTHPYERAQIIRQASLISAPVKICDNCWVGMKSSILHGVTIGTGVVVGAHSLVNRSVKDNRVVAGVPARVIKIRGEK